MISLKRIYMFFLIQKVFKVHISVKCKNGRMKGFHKKCKTGSFVDNVPLALRTLIYHCQLIKQFFLSFGGIASSLKTFFFSKKSFKYISFNWAYI